MNRESSMVNIALLHCWLSIIFSGSRLTFDDSHLHLRMEPLKENAQLTEFEPVKEKVSRLRFLFKLAFICNVFFIVCMILRYSHADQYLYEPVIAISLILGWISPLINLVNFILALILLSRIRKRQIPLWLLYTNIICFILEIYFFFILNDTPHT